MINISKRKVEEEVLERVFQLLFEILGNKSNKDEFFNIIHDILSPKERIMIAKRITIIFLLMKGIKYGIIKDVLKVSETTVAKFQLIMDNSKGIVEALKRQVRNDKIADIFEEIWLEMRGPGVPGVNWKSAWQSKISLKKRKVRGI